MDISRSTIKAHVTDSAWMKNIASQSAVIEKDMKNEGSIIIYAIRSLGSIKDRSPADIHEMMEKGELKTTLQQIYDAVTTILKKIREALKIMQNDEETLLNLYDQIPYGIQKKIGDESILRQIKKEAKEITKKLDEYREYWEDNKKENKITGGFFSDNKKRRIQDSLLRILHEDENINKQMLRVISDIYTKHTLTNWH